MQARRLNAQREGLRLKPEAYESDFNVTDRTRARTRSHREASAGDPPASERLDRHSQVDSRAPRLGKEPLRSIRRVGNKRSHAYAIAHGPTRAAPVPKEPRPEGHAAAPLL